MKIGLALSGGGAMGVAHIGVIKALEKQNLKIDFISGTSAGAIVGLLYAAGGTAFLDQFYLDLKAAGFLSPAAIIIKRNESIFKTIETLLRKRVKAEHFYALDKKFICAATDVEKGEAKIIDRGDPVAAVMASAAYPGVFPIQKIGKYHFVDGSLTKNLPASPLLNLDADFIVGSSLYRITQPKKIEDEALKIGRLETAIRSIDIMSKVIAENDKAKCDFCFEPPVESFLWFQFHKMDEIMILGEKYAEENIDSLLKAIVKKKRVLKEKSLLETVLGKKLFK